jgi:aminocarboxymuconate-semialdehyde decarboxylase
LRGAIDSAKLRALDRTTPTTTPGGARIMMFTCAPDCANPVHGHARYAAATRAGARAKLTKAVKRTGSTARPLRIDLHCHYFNPEVGAKVAHLDPAKKEHAWIFATELTRQTNMQQNKERVAKLSNIEQRLKDMDRMGIDVQAVSPAPFQYYYWADPELGAKLAREVNEGIAAICAKWPDRFVGIGTAPLQDASLAVRELEYAVKTLGLRGVEVNTNVNGANLTDDALGLEPFFRKVQDLDAFMFMHPNGFSEATRLTRHYFNNFIGNPMDTTIAASHLIFDGVLERNPKLKVVLAHSGGYLAHYWARMDHGHAARSDARTVIKKKPSSYLAKFYFDTLAFDTEMLAHSIRKWGADHIVLGTDYPYDMGYYQPLGFIDTVKGLAPADRDRIKGGNAAKLLKIKPTTKAPARKPDPKSKGVWPTKL